MKTSKCSKLKWNHELQASVFTVKVWTFWYHFYGHYKSGCKESIDYMYIPSFFSFVVLFAFRFWLDQHHSKFIWTSAFAIIIFRSELCILLGLIFFLELATRRVSLLTGILHSALAGISAVGTKSFGISFFLLTLFSLPFCRELHMIQMNCIYLIKCFPYILY